MNAWLGRLLGVEDLQAVHDLQVKFAAPWAQDRPALLLFGCVLLVVLAIVFYVRFQALGGWAFDRFFFEGDRYEDRGFNRLEIADGPFLRIQLGVRF